MNRKIVIPAAVLGGIVALALAGGAVLAQTPTPGAKGATVFNYAQAFEQALAQKLGISTTVLQQDYKSAAHDVVAQALAAGQLTQQQADAQNQRIDQSTGLSAEGLGGFGHGGPGGFGGRGGFELGGPAKLQAAADALKMPLADLQTQLQAGKTLAQVAAAQNIPVATLTQALVAAENARIDQAVTAGKLTAAQAATAKQNVAQRVDALINNTLPAPGAGPFGGRRGGFGKRGNNTAPNATPAAPLQ